MQDVYKPRPPLSLKEKQPRKSEKEADAGLAPREYSAKQAARLVNMHRLRAVRLAREAAP
jgi:hypothetical protein